MKRSWVQWPSTEAERCFIISVKNRFRTFIFLFILFSIYIFIFSESGLLERMKLYGEFESLKIRIAGLEEENRSLAASLEKYSAGEYSDRDIAGSGYVKSGGKIIYFNDNAAGASDEPEDRGITNTFELELGHLRIIWILFSFVITFYYFKKRSSGVDEYHG